MPNPYIISSMTFNGGIPSSLNGYRLLDVLRDTIICVDYESLSVKNLYTETISSDSMEANSVNANSITAETITNDFIQRLSDIVPDEASEENKLVDASSMMSSIVKYSPTFRGSFENWSEVEYVENYLPDEFGKKEPDKNDYMVISSAHSYPGGQLNNTWRFRYTGVWDDDGPRGWKPEYQVNIPPFTT
jgi:hypothetical protein